MRELTLSKEAIAALADIARYIAIQSEKRGVLYEAQVLKAIEDLLIRPQ